MDQATPFEVIIIGGSYAGLSAAMTLGRALRKVLIIDSGNPCNSQTPHSHNFLTNDGEKPQDLAARAKAQVLQYRTIQFLQGKAVKAQKTDGFFEIKTENGQVFKAEKLLFATGLTDIMPEIPGFATCWGISILHCPYCHGYEVKGKKTGIFGNGEIAFEKAKMVSHWTGDLTIFTNGKAVFSEAELEKFKSNRIEINEQEIKRIEQSNGQITNVIFKNGSKHHLEVLYAHLHTQQQCELFAPLGCKTNAHGCIETDVFQKTNIPGIYAAGDCSSVGRAVSVAVSAGTVAGMFLNKEMIDAVF